MQKRYKELLALVPTQPEWKIDWDAIEDSAFSFLVEKMKVTMQNPVWHGEGDVWTHTKMVCEALVHILEFRALEKRKQEEVFLAALLHDIGKVPCTKWEDDAWTSPNHTLVGSKMAREWLWKEYGFCGEKSLQEFRETICNLIRYHSVPSHLLDLKHPEFRLHKVASNGELTPDFTIELLCILSEADMRGRIYDKTEESLEKLEICRETARDCGCFQGTLEFPDAFSEYAYLSGRKILPGQSIYDNTWGEIVVMCGLPGTGKDTWIKENFSGYPVVSLDDFRLQMHVSPKEEQGLVVNAARELAKEYLRKKVPFVWNATNLTPMIRGKLVNLFVGYGASVRIVFLETEWDEELKRNRERKAQVPERVIENMLGYMVVPERMEAYHVEWHCV